MSLRTCSWLLPQNEQRYGTFVPLLPLVVLTRCPRYPVDGLRRATPASGLRLLLFLCLRGRFRLRRFRRLRHAGAFATGEAGIVGCGDQGRPWEVVDGIDDAIVLCLIGTHEPVALRVPDHLLDRLACVPRKNLVVQVNKRLPLLHLDERVLRRATKPARALVDHDPAVRQAVAL